MDQFQINHECLKNTTMLKRSSEEPSTSSDSESISMSGEDRTSNEMIVEKGRSEKSNFDIIVKHLDSLSVKDSEFMINEFSQIEFIYQGIKQLISIPFDIFLNNNEYTDKNMNEEQGLLLNDQEWNWRIVSNNRSNNTNHVDFCKNDEQYTWNRQNINMISEKRHVHKDFGRNQLCSKDTQHTASYECNQLQSTSIREIKSSSFELEKQNIEGIHEIIVDNSDSHNLRIDSDNVEVNIYPNSTPSLDQYQGKADWSETKKSKRGTDYKKVFREFKKYFIKEFSAFEKAALKDMEESIANQSFWDKLNLYIMSRQIWCDGSQAHHYYLGLVINPARTLEWKHENSDHQNDQYELDSKRQPVIIQDLIFKFSLSKAKEFFKQKENQVLFSYFIERNESIVQSWLFEVQSLKELY